MSAPSSTLTLTRHILHANQFEPEFISELFERAAWMDAKVKGDALEELDGILRHRRLASLFYEPSTRTRFSFEWAAKILGMRVSGSENAGEFSSRAKGESDLDAFRVMAGMHPHAIVVRHDRFGELAQIAEQLDAGGYHAPIINAGDGSGQHPTQALLDLYTIQNELGRLDNLRVVMVGDLKNGRTVRSLTYLLAKYPGNQLTFVAPPDVQMQEDILRHLDNVQAAYKTSDDLDAVLGDADVVYVTRIQAERGMDQVAYDQVAGRYRFTTDQLQLLPGHARVMHPLPRVQTGSKQRVKLENSVVEVTLVNELDPACDADPRAAYFRQAANGLPVRMALLEWVIGGGDLA